MENAERQDMTNPVAPALQSGLSSGIGLLLWGAIVLYCPTYFHATGWVASVVYVLAVALLSFSVGILFSEVAKALRIQSLNDVGAVVVFLGLAALVWSKTVFRPFSEPVQFVAQLAAVLFALVAAIFLSNVLAALPAAIVRGSVMPSPDPRVRAAQRTEHVRLLLALGAAALSFLGALLGLATLIVHILSGK
jgi:hypothetical protein